MKVLLAGCMVFVIQIKMMNQYQASKKMVTKGGMTVRWKVEDEILIVTMIAQTSGWLAIGFNHSDQLAGTNLLMGAVEQGFYRVEDRFIVAPGNHKAMTELGARDQILHRHGKERNGETVIEFAIPLQATDDFHLSLQEGGEYFLLMAYSLEDDFEHHSIMRTSTKIKL
ncbi:MAG: DOMON domain-containing protein [Cyclobacteriaceae bacterium]